MVTGVHRSETTWLGSLLATASQATVVHEPLNALDGLIGVPCWYPHLTSGNTNQAETPFSWKTAALLDDIVTGRAKWRRTYLNVTSLRKAGRAIFGSSGERSYRKACLNDDSAPFIVKDPFCLFSAAYLIENYDAKILITIRHPAALIGSMRRMGWSPSILSLVSQPLLMKTYLPEYNRDEITQLAEGDDIFANFVFWLAAYRFSTEMADKYPNNVFLVEIEKLSTGKDQILDQLLSHVGLEGGYSFAEKFISETTHGETVVPADGILHVFYRNADALATFWHNKLTDDEKAKLNSLLLNAGASHLLVV